MKSVALKLDDAVFAETEYLLKRIKKPRNRYINEALVCYNKMQKQELLAAQLEAESLMVAEESMKVLEEFDHIGDGYGEEI